MRLKFITKCIKYLNEVIDLEEPTRTKNSKIRYVIAVLEEELLSINRRYRANVITKEMRKCT